MIDDIDSNTPMATDAEAMPTTSGHMMHPNDPENPQNWPFLRKLHVSAAAFGYTFTLLFGATCYTTGLAGIMEEFDVSMTKAIAGYSLYIWGIFFAPIVSPHITEKFGRNIPYIACTLGLSFFTLGAGYSRTFTQLAVCRFFAGFFGGPNAVQIEGTFADVWPALYTLTYYSFLTCASYFGAAVGAIVGYNVIPSEDWRWTQYLTLMVALAALLLGTGAPETYGRRVMVIQARRAGRTISLPPAPTGVTFAEMARHTVVNPIIMLASQPLVTMITLYLALNFGVLFSWFISVPVVVTTVYGFTPHMGGDAFSTALGGMVVGAIFTIIIDQISTRMLVKKNLKGGMFDIEYRLISAIIGACLIFASIFWIGWTAKPTVSFYSPIVGNGFYVVGSAMNLIAFISYLFDAYPPQGTLSALTSAACGRIAFAGIIPMVIITAFTNLTGAWALSVFGFIALAFLPFPIILLIFGKRLRQGSSFYNKNHTTPLTSLTMGEMHKMEEMT